MGALIWSLIAFIGTHFLLSHPLRKPLVAKLGDAGFQGLYSVVAIGTFIWVILAFQDAPRGADFWPVGDGLWGFASMLMLIGSILFAGSLIGNPAMPMPGAEKSAAAPARGVFAITRHPMMWGFALWGIVHLLVAPYAASIALTLGMVFLALAGSYGQDHKKAAIMGDAWKDWASRTSFMPLGNQIAGRASWSTAWPGLRPVLIGIVLWLIASWAHPLLGAPIAGLWRWL